MEGDLSSGTALDHLKTLRSQQRAASPASTATSEQPPGDTEQQAAKAPRSVEKLVWNCTVCERECVPIRSESRCLCGHRLREHKGGRCTNAKCACKDFFFIVAEGSWILRCCCKHKHVEHDPVTRACAKPKCECGQFDSPWVCNCDHPWSQHRQETVTVQVQTLEDMIAKANLASPADAAAPGASLAPEVNRWDLVQRGLPS